MAASADQQLADGRGLGPSSKIAREVRYPFYTRSVGWGKLERVQAIVNAPGQTVSIDIAVSQSAYCILPSGYWLLPTAWVQFPPLDLILIFTVGWVGMHTTAEISDKSSDRNADRKDRSGQVRAGMGT